MFVSVAWSAYFFGNRWVAYRLDFATSIFIGACAFMSVLLVSILPDHWLINPGNLGLTLTYSTSLLIWFQWGIRQSAIAENIVRVARITRNIEKQMFVIPRELQRAL